MLDQYPKVALIEILKQQHKRSYIKNLHGSVIVEAFIATMTLIRDTDGVFVQRAEVIYKVLDDGRFNPVYILSAHEDTLDIRGYMEFFGTLKASSSKVNSTQTEQLGTLI
jgi:hypothetical protein